MNVFILIGLGFLAGLVLSIKKNLPNWIRVALGFSATLSVAFGSPEFSALLSILGEVALIASVFVLSGVLVWTSFGVGMTLILHSGKLSEIKIKHVQKCVAALVISTFGGVVFNALAKAHDSYPEMASDLKEFVILLGHPAYAERLGIMILIVATSGAILGVYKKRSQKNKE
jgi:hypothetical protein